MDILDVINWICKAWNELEPITIIKSWRKLLDHKATNEWDGEKIEESYYREEIDAGDDNLIFLLSQIPGGAAIERRDISNWVAADDNVELTEYDIVHLITGLIGEEDDEVETDDSVAANVRVIDTEALQVLKP